MERRTKKTCIGCIYCGMIALVVYFGHSAVTAWFNRDQTALLEYCDVTVSGNVEKPGVYRVPEGTTRFELLKAAGVRSTSDISTIMLLAQVGANDKITVGTQKAVALKDQPVVPRLEYAMGAISIIGADGRNRPQQTGLELESGDRIQTEERSQADISIGNLPRIDMDNFSEIILSKLNVQEKDRRVFEIGQKSGACWYNLTYEKKGDQFRIMTPLAILTIGGNGANVMVEIDAQSVTVHNLDGLVLIERVSGEAVNQIAGQTAVIFNDARPIQVGRLSADVNPSIRFSTLVKEKTNFLLKNVPFNLLFCGIPNVYYLFSIQYTTGRIVAVHIPAETAVDQFAQGFTTLDQAFLYGGPVFVSTLIEQILYAKASKYCVFEQKDIYKTIGALGGITVPMDDKAASILHTKNGPQKLTSAQVLKYLNPAVSGWEDSRRRQVETLKALFNGLKNGNIAISAMLVEQLMGSIQTNFTSNEVMKEYAKFSARKNWEFKNYPLPARTIKKDNRNIADPILEQSRELIYKQD